MAIEKRVPFKSYFNQVRDFGAEMVGSTGIVDFGFPAFDKMDGGFTGEAFYEVPLTGSATIVTGAGASSAEAVNNTVKARTYYMMQDYPLTVTGFQNREAGIELLNNRKPEALQSLTYEVQNVWLPQSVNTIFGDFGALGTGQLEDSHSKYYASAFDATMFTDLTGIFKDKAQRFNRAIVHSTVFQKLKVAGLYTNVDSVNIGQPNFQSGEYGLIDGIKITINDDLCNPTQEMEDKFSGATGGDPKVYPFYVYYDQPFYVYYIDQIRSIEELTGENGGTILWTPSTIGGAGIKGVSWNNVNGPTTIAGLQTPANYLKIFANDRDITVLRGLTKEG